jgi:hypothetical protein
MTIDLDEDNFSKVWGGLLVLDFNAFVYVLF